MRLVRFGWFYFGKMWKNMEKRLFFRADMAGLGKYCTGGYGRIGVYRVNLIFITFYMLSQLLRVTPKVIAYIELFLD